MNAALIRLWAVIDKDVRSEIRTRYGLTSLIVFVVTTVMLVAFSIADEAVPRPMAAGLLWVVMTFTANVGLGRGFIREEERGTWLYLRLSTTASAVLFGKLLVNIAQAVVANTLAYVMLLLVIGDVFTGNVLALITSIVVGSAALAGVLTVMSAISARAQAGGLLLPVLAVPVILPIVLPGTASVLQALADFSLFDVAPNLGIIAAYAGIVVVVSWILFDYIWDE
jgi:heme exporter protein B